MKMVDYFSKGLWNIVKRINTYVPYILQTTVDRHTETLPHDIVRLISSYVLYTPQTVEELYELKKMDVFHLDLREMKNASDTTLAYIAENIPRIMSIIIEVRYIGWFSHNKCGFTEDGLNHLTKLKYIQNLTVNIDEISEISEI